MNKSFKIFAAAISMGAALAGSAMAQTEPASSISELLNRVRSDSREMSAENQRRLQEFREARGQQSAMLAQARSQLSALEGQAAGIRAQYDENEARIDELGAQLREAQGEFGELFGAARQTAGEFASIIDASIISAQVPNRTATLVELSESRALPGTEQLSQIHRRMTEEMILQGQVVTFDRVVNGLGGGQPVSVTRVGPFIAWADDGGVTFVQWTEGENGDYDLSPLERQPPADIVNAASRVTNASSDEIVMGPIDPSRGGLLAIYRNVPNLQERIAQGRTVGYIILGLLAISVAFGLLRLVQLMLESAAVAAQKRRSTPSRGNSLGRVMGVYEEFKDRDIETIELKLDEAILRETPKLEFGLNFLKLAAGIAPLLGLLGTVTGMIRTFTQITLFGTGDPKIMAGGISEALVTTVLGLVSAIPLLFIHSFAASFARGVQQVLEEQAAGMVARSAEERRPS